VGLMFPEEEMLGVDLVIPDFSYLRENVQKLRAVFLTHGHEDHVGALAYFQREFNVPIYSTRLTDGLIRVKLGEHRLLQQSELHVVEPGDRITAGVFEVEFGVTTFRDLIFAPVYGGGIRDGNQLKAFIPGGASAPWFFEEHLDVPLEAGAVGAAGSMLGSGAIVVMDDTTDAVKAAWRVVRFFSRESCGKCTPCREGTREARIVVDHVARRQGRAGDVDELKRLARMMNVASFCGLGQSAAWPIESALKHFGNEFQTKDND